MMVKMYECSGCHAYSEIPAARECIEGTECDTCHKPLKRVYRCRIGTQTVTEAAAQYGGSWEITLEHVEARPKHFQGKRSLRNYLRKTGLESSALL